MIVGSKIKDQGSRRKGALSTVTRRFLAAPANFDWVAAAAAAAADVAVAIGGAAGRTAKGLF